MDPHPAATPHLPSGQWNGFYAEWKEREPHGFEVEFVDGVLRGKGEDTVGPFLMEGEYRATAEGAVRVGWIKTYVESHSVLYLCQYDGECMVGEWRIGDYGDDCAFWPASRGKPRRFADE